MNSVFCKYLLGTRGVLISTFPGTGTLESQKIISVLSYHLIGLVEIPGIEFSTARLDYQFLLA